MRLSRVFIVVISIALVSIVLATSALAQEQLRQDDFKTHYDKGVELLNAKKYKLALKELKQAVAINPKSADTHFKLGYLYVQKHDFEKALEEYKIVTKLQPDNYKGHLYCGALTKLDLHPKINKANMDFKTNSLNESIRLNPNDPYAHYFLSMQFDSEKEIDKILKELDIAIKLKPDCLDFYSEKSFAFFRYSRITDSKTDIYNQNNYDVIKEAIKANPNNAEAYYQLGRMYFDTNLIRTEENINLALEMYKEAVRLDPSFTDAFRHLSICYYRKNDYANAVQAIKEVFRINPDFINRDYAYGYYFEQNNDLKRAYHEYSKAESNQDWKSIPIDEKAKVPAIAIDSFSNPHVCYIDENKHLKYATLENGNWQYQILDDTEMLVRKTWIQIDTDDMPHILYNYGKDRKDNFRMKYIWFDGDNWHSENIGKPGINYSSTGFVLDSLNRPHVIYYNRTDKNLVYNWRDINGSWNHEEIISNKRVVITPAIAIDRLNRVQVSFIDNEPYTLKYGIKYNKKWHFETVCKDTGSSDSCTITINENNQPYIAFTQNANQYKLAYKDNNIWRFQLVANSEDLFQEQQRILNDGTGWSSYIFREGKFDTTLKWASKMSLADDRWTVQTITERNPSQFEATTDSFWDIRVCYTSSDDEKLYYAYDRYNSGIFANQFDWIDKDL